jgi:hypothetical protein
MIEIYDERGSAVSERNDLVRFDESKPYVFISYAHKDSALIMPALRAMQESGYRIWFDQGIEAGTEWSNNIAAHLRDCDVFVAFISKNSAASENCLDEIAYAKSHQKKSLLIFLESDVVLPEGAEMQTARFQRMFLYRQDSMADFILNLSRSPMFDSCREEQGAGAAVLEPAPVKKPKKLPSEEKKKSLFPLFLIIGGVVLLLAVILLFALSGEDDPKDEPGTNEGAVQTEEKEILMSDDPADLTFLLDGVVYQLPFDFSRLAKNGWNIADGGYSSTTLVAGHGIESFRMVRDGQFIGIEVYNNSGNALEIAQCTVVEIQVSATVETFQVAKGITAADSVDKVEQTLGTPSGKRDGQSSVRLIYGDAETLEYGVILEIQKDEADKKYSYITVKSKLPEDKKTETSKDVPDYLSEYTAPASLGNDLYSGTIQIEGDLYRIPAPLSAFIQKGWKMESSPSHLAAGETGKQITLSRNGKKMDVRLANFASYQTTPENCAVTRVYIEDDKDVSFVLPREIKDGMTLSQVESLIPSDMEKSGSGTTIRYSHYIFKDRDFCIYISVDVETDKIEYIVVEEEVWK